MRLYPVFLVQQAAAQFKCSLQLGKFRGTYSFEFFIMLHLLQRYGLYGTERPVRLDKRQSELDSALVLVPCPQQDSKQLGIGECRRRAGASAPAVAHLRANPLCWKCRS